MSFSIYMIPVFTSGLLHWVLYLLISVVMLISHVFQRRQKGLDNAFATITEFMAQTTYQCKVSNCFPANPKLLVTDLDD